MRIRHAAAAALAAAATAALSVGVMSPASAAATVVHPQVADNATLTKATIEFFTTSDNKDFDTFVATRVTDGDLNFGNINITITPNGNDTWNFFYLLELTFSDGSIEDVDSPPLHLTQDSRINNTDLVF